METQLGLALISPPKEAPTITPKQKKVPDNVPTLGKSTKKSADNLTNTFRKLTIYKKKQRKNIIKWAKTRRGVLARKRAEMQLEQEKDARAGKTGFKKVMKDSGIKPLQYILAILTGWIINQLPVIIEKGKKFLEKIKPVIDVLKGVVKGIVKVFEWIWEGIKKVWSGIQNGIKSIQSVKEKLEAGFDKVKGIIKKAKDGFDQLIGKSKKGQKDIQEQLGVDGKGEDKAEGADIIDPADKEDSAIIDTKKGEVEGKTPPKPKTNRDEVTTSTNIKGDLTTITFDGKTYPRGISGPMETFGGKGGSTYQDKALKTDTSTAKLLSSSPKTNIDKLKKPKKQKIITVPVPSGGGSSQLTGGSSGSDIVASDPNKIDSTDLLMAGIE